MKIYENILGTVGNTPLVKLHSFGSNAEIIAKLESFNPGGSAKDRVGIAMIEAAEKNGVISAGGTIIEPTSGNTGVGLAIAAAVKGYKLILTMPDSMSVERQKLLAAYGAKIVLTPGNAGMAGAIAKAAELQKNTPNSFIPGQFSNPANPEAHRHSTALEILDDCDGKVDAVVAGVGTGGTLTGIAEVLKKRLPEVKIFAVEPVESAVLSGGTPGVHKLQGIGAGFIPEVMNTAVVDEVITVAAEDAGNAARTAAQKEGILTGISGGAALFAAQNVAARSEFAGKRIIVILPDTGERYLSTWLFA